MGASSRFLIEQTQQRLAAQSITLEVGDEARQLLVERGCDQAYETRPLRRAVQRMLEDMLAEAILQGTFTSGNPVLVDSVHGELSASHRFSPRMVEAIATGGSEEYEAA